MFEVGLHEKKHRVREEDRDATITSDATLETKGGDRDICHASFGREWS